MELSRTELNILKEIANGKNKVRDIAEALNKDKSQIYRTIKKLENKDFIKLNNKIIITNKLTHVQLLLQELSRQPSFINNLSGCGIKLYTFISDNAKTIDEIIDNTKIKRSTIFAKFEKACRNNFIKKISNKYVLNNLWSKIKEFLNELKKYEETNDKRIPEGSTIYYKNEKEIIFSTKSKCDAALTGFSAYELFGIKIYTKDNTYYLPKKKLTIKEVFIHSIYYTEKEKTVQNIILISLFYIKHKKYLSRIKHEIINNIKKIMKGEKISSYPTFEEIKQRADMYDIEMTR
jgi:DNA-binding Lrp family transcriptional regulator